MNDELNVFKLNNEDTTFLDICKAPGLMGVIVSWIIQSLPR